MFCFFIVFYSLWTVRFPADEEELRRVFLILYVSCFVLRVPLAIEFFDTKVLSIFLKRLCRSLSAFLDDE